MQSDGSVRLQKGVFGSSVQKETQKSHRLCISASTMASCWSGRRGSNSLPPPWQGGALPDELRPHTDNAFCVIGAPAKICGEKEKVLHDFRRGASDRNRTNDTGIFSPLLYRLSYRGITGAFVPAPSQILSELGPPQMFAQQRFVGKRRNFSVCCGGPACRTARQTADIPTSDPDRARTDDPQRDRLVL